jgi:hypothetical protein
VRAALRVNRVSIPPIKEGLEKVFPGGNRRGCQGIASLVGCDRMWSTACSRQPSQRSDWPSATIAEALDSDHAVDL